MGAESVSSVIVPSKFVLAMCQLLLVVVILQTREDFIYAGIEETYTTSSDEYKSADAELLAATVIFIFFLCVEFLLLMLGLSVFFDKANIF